MVKNKVSTEISNRNKSKRKDNFFNKNKVRKIEKFSQQKHSNFQTSTTGGTTADDFFIQPIKSDEKVDSGKSPQEKSIQKDKTDKSVKKPFDKKLWRLQKYSKKYKLQEWEDKRKKAVLRGYYRKVKEESDFDVKKIYEEEEGATSIKGSNEINEDNLKKKGKAFKKAQQEFERIKGEKEAKKEEFLRRRKEKEEALKEYKRKKNEKFKKLNRKTKKGQPIMKERMEMLLEQIQNSLKNN